MVTTFAFTYLGKYVGYDGTEAADGYTYHVSAKKALQFTTRAEAERFATEIGPAWLVEYFKKGTISIVMLKDGVPSI